MQVDKAIELFQIVVIVSLNMGNFNLEVSSLKIDWPQRRRRRLLELSKLILILKHKMVNYLDN